MLVELPRLTNSLRIFLQNQNKPQRPGNSLDDSELAGNIVHNWEQASSEVRQAYKKFLGSIVELIDGEVSSEEFRQVAKTVYRLFGAPQQDDVKNNRSKISGSKKEEFLGYNVPDIKIQKVASLAQKLFLLQPSGNSGNGDDASVSEVRVDVGGENSAEFGSELVFHAPTRFLVDESLESSMLSSLQGEEYNHIESVPNSFVVDNGKVDLRWLRDECDQIVRQSGSQLPRDELAMALCQVLDSDRAGDEIAGELLDLVGDGAFEIVQDLLKHRKELVEAIHHGIVVLKSEKAPTSQPKMPSYGTQVTIQTETGKQIDKLRRKEEKRQRRGTENDLSSGNFSSLLEASESKGLFDDLIGSGQGSSKFLVNSLPQGTVRKNLKGYEEVSIPATETAQMKPGERLIEIKELDDFAQAAFHGYKSLNRIQSRIYQATYHTNDNILVCAPTGAGKTNIAMIAVLHEIKQHYRDGILHKNEFKVVYVAPMKALAAEVTATFSRRLAPLNMNVKELTGDMQLSRSELEETQMIVTTPEKWDVITRNC